MYRIKAILQIIIVWKTYLVLAETEQATTDVSSDLHFYLYTDNDTPTEISVDNPGSIGLGKFKKNLDTKMLFHGALESYQSDSVQRLRKAYQKKGSYNLIVLDYKKLVANPYIATALYTRSIGYVSAKMVQILVDQYGANVDKIHVIGFSLGAHICAFIGHKIKVSRITGLDPSNHLTYPVLNEESGLDSSDAKFVDVIHASQLGYFKVIGHADFFASGGMFQPKCFPLDILCNHYMSWRYFVDSIAHPDHLKGATCKNIESAGLGTCDLLGRKTILGDSIKTTTRGIFYQNMLTWDGKM